MKQSKKEMNITGGKDLSKYSLNQLYCLYELYKSLYTEDEQQLTLFDCKSKVQVVIEKLAKEVARYSAWAA